MEEGGARMGAPEGLAGEDPGKPSPSGCGLSCGAAASDPAAEADGASRPLPPATAGFRGSADPSSPEGETTLLARQGD